MDCQIGELRATVFTGPVVYDNPNLKRVSELLPEEDGFVPSQVTPIQFVPGLNIPVPVPQGGMPVEWEMFSQKTQFRIHFGPQKIDIVKSTFSKNEVSGYELSFCSWASQIFEKIVNRFSLTPTRLAYAPTYTPDWTKDFPRQSFINSVYSKNEFKGEKLTNLLFKHVFRVKHELGTREVLFNYVAEASDGQALIQDEKNKKLNVKQMLNLSLDINTFQGSNLEFSKEDLKEFFEKATYYGQEFLEYYIG